jgi:hypothetical protein
MTWKTLALAAASALALSMGASSANAVVTVQIWADVQAAAENATIAQAALLGAADEVATVGAIDFREPSNSAVSTIADFLNNPADLDPTVGNLVLNNTYFLFTGTLFLNAGVNSFVVPHDDGLQLTIGGIPGFIVDAPGPTGEVNTPFDVVAPAAGTYNFTLSYGECCGGPAVLRFVVNDAPVGGGVPEPMTWALMIGGFAGVGGVLRRKRAHAFA